MASGVFSLRKVYKKQVQNVTDNNFASWPEGSTYGYYVGGTSPTIATIARLDFFNETASNLGNNYPSPIRGAAATSNNFYAYIAGGLSAIYVCLVRRLDFSNETVSFPGNNLPSSRGYIAATSSDPYGYYAGGGYSTPQIYFNTITRLDFSNETISNPGKNLPEAIDNLAATSSNSYGYYAGGFNFPPPTYFNTITRLDFTNETVSNPGNNLLTARTGSEGTSSNSYGYFGGGRTPSPTINTITRLDFSNETVSDPGNNFLTARKNSAATSSNSYGYFGGGRTPSPYLSTITRLDFSNETVSDPGNDLPFAKEHTTAVSGGVSILRGKGYGTYGYFAGGGSNPIGATPFFSKIERIDFSSEVFSVLSNSLPETIRGINAVSSNSYGYYCGGLLPPPAPLSARTSKINRIDYSNETLLTPGNDLSQPVSGKGTLSNSFYGYLGGGFSGDGFSAPYINTITRLDFSNETVSDPGNNLPTARSGLSATSSNSYGYFGGGSFPNPPAFPVPSGVTCAIDRLDFSNETVSTPGNNLSQKVFDLASVSNNSYGYYGGGRFNGPPDPLSDISSSVDRHDFSTETTLSLGTILPSQRMFLLAGTSSSFYGYFGGGYSTPFTLSNVNRLDFSNDTMSAQSNKLVNETYDMGATSNSN